MEEAEIVSLLDMTEQGAHHIKLNAESVVVMVMVMVVVIVVVV